MPLMLTVQLKYVPKNTIIVEQGESCKYLYWHYRGEPLLVLRRVLFIEALNRPLREQITIKEPHYAVEEIASAEAALPF